jgi:signal transduction histidine kinase/CheY-like chemotaxis protein
MRILICAVVALTSLIAAPVLSATPKTAAPVDQSAPFAPNLDLSEFAVSCVLPSDETLDTVLARGCTWRPLNEKFGFVRPLKDRSLWTRVAFRNPTNDALVQDFTMLTSVEASQSVFVWQGDSWLQVNSTSPSGQRGAGGRGQAVRLWLPPKAITTIYVKVSGGGMLRVQPQLWKPRDLELEVERTKLLLATFNGVAVASVIFAVLMYLISKQRECLSFSLGLTAATLADSSRIGVLLRALWPSSPLIPGNVSAIGAGVAVIIGAVFVRQTLPGITRQGGWHQLMIVTVIVAALGATLSAVIDFDALLWVFWQMSLVILVALLAVQSGIEWRRGDPVGAWFLGAGVVTLLGISARFLEFLGGLTIAGWEFRILPSTAAAVALLLLLGLVQRSGAIARQLALTQAKSTAQIDFLAKMSHELRAPLDAVLGNAQLLLRRADQHKNDGLEAILRSGRDLLRMIDDIVDYARGVSGAIIVSPEPVDLKALLQFVAVDLNLFASRNRNRFAVRCHGAARDDGPLWVQADATRLRAVLDNLIINASRHTEDGWIYLDCTVARPAAREYRVDFSVTDTGEGIAPEDLQRIFEPFERAGRQGARGAVDRRLGHGSGLGLAICRQFVQLMGGQLHVNSGLGKGASFRFSLTLPAADVPAGASGAEFGDTSLLMAYVGPRRRIMVVDNNAGSLAILQTLLGATGFEVVTAGSGNEAVRELKAGLKIDLMIVDQLMDDGDGWEVLESADRIAPDVPRILISATYPTSGKRIEAELLYSAFVTKPIDHQRLLRCIGDLLSLQWSFGARTSEGSDSAVEADLSSEDRQVFARLVSLGAVTHIRRWTLDVRQRRPEIASFAASVDQAVDEVDFPRLRRLAGMAERTRDDHDRTVS